MPLLAMPMKHRAAVQPAALMAVMPVGPALRALVGPLIGLPCCTQVAPPSVVATIVPIAPPAKQLELSRHAIPVSACALLLLVCCVQVEPPSVDLSMTAFPEATAPVA